MRNFALVLLLGVIILISGCIGSLQPNVKISTCQLRDNQISSSQTTSFIVVVMNQDDKLYQNTVLSIERNPKVIITDSGQTVGQTISLTLQPNSQITKAFDIKGSVESGQPYSPYTILVRAIIDGKDVDTCTQTLKVVQ